MHQRLPVVFKAVRQKPLAHMLGAVLQQHSFFPVALRRVVSSDPVIKMHKTLFMCVLEVRSRFHDLSSSS
jgi:hypothetical protein